MGSFNKKLAAAKRVPRPHADVTIALRADLADKRAAIEERRADIQSRFVKAEEEAQSDPRLTSKVDVSAYKSELDALVSEIEALDIEEADSLVTLRFWEIPGQEWADIIVRHPAREGVTIDANVGYNVHSATKEAAELNGRVVEAGRTTQVSKQQWSDLWEQVPGRSFSAICDTIWSLNEYDPMNRLMRLKKASAPKPETSPDSLE